jgi:hypothetical protein
MGRNTFVFFANLCRGWLGRIEVEVGDDGVDVPNPIVVSSIRGLDGFGRSFFFFSCFYLCMKNAIF